MQEFEWIENLEGRIDYEQKAKEWTWLGVGGNPFFTFYPKDKNDLQQFCKNRPEKIPFRTIGAASNMLVRDGGYKGIFIRLTKGFRKMEILENEIIADTGLSAGYIVNAAKENDKGGISFMSTIPGMLGGMIRMNAGAHENEMSEIINWVEFLDKEGIEHRIKSEECKFSYRSSVFQNDWIILRASIKCKIGRKEKIEEEIIKLKEKREKTQPTRGKLAGCFFKNHLEKPAWKAIRESDFGMFNSENLQVSPVHANFIVNKNNASAFEIEYLLEKIRANILFKQNIWLESEVERIGYY